MKDIIAGKCVLEDIEVTEKFVPKQLRSAAAIYEERNAMYGDNYKAFGKVWAELFPDGMSVASAQDPVSAANRMGLIVQIIGKLGRYCANFDRGGHADSLDDLAVYAMMLQELDMEAKLKSYSYMHGVESLPQRKPLDPPPARKG